MIELVEVDDAWRPPADEPWVLVRVAQSSTSETDGIIVQAMNSAIFKAANNPVDVANALTAARQWAEQNGLTSVYVARAIKGAAR